KSVVGAKQPFTDQEHQSPRKTPKTPNVEPSLLGCTLEILSRMGLQRSKLRSTGSPFAFFASFAAKSLLLICDRTLRALSSPSPDPLALATASGTLGTSFPRPELDHAQRQSRPQRSHLP